jgi:hypothetical protein
MGSLMTTVVMLEQAKIIQMNGLPSPGFHYQEVMMETELHPHLHHLVTRAICCLAIGQISQVMMNAVDDDSHLEAEGCLKDGLDDENVPCHPVMINKVILIDKQMQ